MARRPQWHEARFEAAAEDPQPLAGSLQALVAGARAKRGAEIAFILQLPDTIAIPASIEVAGYRICEAAIDNAMRHAAARRVTVELSWRHEKLIVRIADDGVGFDPTGPRLGPRKRGGLERMEDVARAVGGRLDLRSAPGAGTCISALFPIEGTHELKPDAER